jgi:hypothetical protein
MPLKDRLVRVARTLFSDRRAWAIGATLLILPVYPLSCGAIGGHIVTSKATAKLGLPVSAEKARAGWGVLRLQGVTVGSPDAPLLTVDGLEIPFAALWGGGTFVVTAPRASIQLGGEGDNISATLARLRGGSAAAGPAKVLQPPRRSTVVVREGSVRLRDEKRGLAVMLGVFDATWEPDKRFQVDAHQVSGRFGTQGQGVDEPNFGAAGLTVEGELHGLRPTGWPELTVHEGFIRPLTTLPLTGISGAVKPVSAAGVAPGTFDLFFSGSYGGAKRALWTATGRLRPSADRTSADGTIAIRAERFSLDKIAEILPPNVLDPESTEIDGSIEAKLTGRQVSFSGKLGVTGLSLLHEKLASEPVNDMTFSVRLVAAVDLDQRRLSVSELEGRIGALVVQLGGSVELVPGSFRFKNGREIHSLPKVDVQLRVPRVACSKLLASIPGPIVPRLQGFSLQGFFEADVHTKIDFANLDALELGGKVGIDGCQVVRAPSEVTALADSEALVQTVEVPPLPNGSSGAVELMDFIIGPENPDFVPYARISPYLVNAIMTTEDSGFFKHRGWVSPEFKTALKRNLAGGGFRLGASSITMQTVKNVLLSHEKTLSRKLQELFLVWYVEKILPKERILELYFNAIEFGPRLYGIGPAARHYFGKSASDINPLEATFFSSILPSPKRRYEHYCHGSLSPKWEKYLRRILQRMYERGRLTEEEFAAANASTLSFDRAEMTMSEKQCLDWLRRITAKPEETEPEAESP